MFDWLCLLWLCVNYFVKRVIYALEVSLNDDSLTLSHLSKSFSIVMQRFSRPGPSKALWAFSAPFQTFMSNQIQERQTQVRNSRIYKTHCLSQRSLTLRNTISILILIQ